MDLDQLGSDARKAIHEILGYLNFSSGTVDATFLRNLNRLFATLAERPASNQPAWQAVASVLRCGLEELHEHSEAFRQSDQAEAVLGLVFEQTLQAYRQFHRDLLFHQTDEALFQPFFLGRVCEVVLAEGPPWNEADRIVTGAIARLNDFIGHRPVAVLRTAQKIQPYAHEFVRPIPLYIQGAGVASGPYREVIELALEILRTTPSELLDRAWFTPEALEELAVDPRAYDFDHPVNRRPNYHFGGWDPHCIDNRGLYRRYVLQQVTLDALWNRVNSAAKPPRDELLFEAAAVVAGTILMGSGISGNRPETHDSSVTLANLLPHIAGYRDAFYEQLLNHLSGSHAERLRTEARLLRQPFGGARQHLNHSLARRRAEQLQHVHLARLFARMGYTEAAQAQAQIVPVASARMRCEIDCRLAAADLAIGRAELAPAAALLPEIEDLLRRAIECGAMVDPWNILGFGGQFSKFPAVEDSIHDHRVDELIALLNEIFSLYARLQEEAAAAGEDRLLEQLSERLRLLAEWWDRFATTGISGVDSVSGRQAWESAAQVSTAVRAWHRAGTAAGNIAFWRRQVEEFRSAKAYSLLVEALLNQGDLVAAMALLVQWLSRAQEIPLAEGSYSFHGLASRWMDTLWSAAGGEGAAADVVEPAERWPMARKFFDYLEANADEFWIAPRLELSLGNGGSPDVEPSQEEDEEDLFSAAYEGVIYRDTTDDGFEGEMLEWGAPPATDFELTNEAERISGRLAFLATVARLWRVTALATVASPPADRGEVLSAWLQQLADSRRHLSELLAAVHHYRIPTPRGTQESLIEFDRRRGIKEMLLERIIAASTEIADTLLVIRSAMDNSPAELPPEDWQTRAERVLHSLIVGDARTARHEWPGLLDALVEQPLLYLPVVRGGNPQKIVQSRVIQQVLRRLLVNAPRLGLLSEAYRMLGTVQQMERRHPAGPGAITEFDRVFEIGCSAILRCVVESSATWRPRGRSAGSADRQLVDTLERAIELLLRRWLAHSRNVRISVLETISDRGRWKELRQFIQRYGHDLFTQKFMNFSNLRAILHQGVDSWLHALADDPETADQFQLLGDLGQGIPREEAVRWLELTLEAVVENYSAYVDYNSTTTQSDRGEMLYTLLDFMRVEASYGRVAWNLKPVVIAHEVLVRAGRDGAAELWRRMVAQRSGAVADEHLQRLERLVNKYGMRLPSIADRLGERFVKPLAVDRLCALVRPAVEEIRQRGDAPSFELLQREIEPFTRNPSGIGFDVPVWLEALEGEIERIRAGAADEDDTVFPSIKRPPSRLSLDEVQRQISAWEEDAL